MENAQTEMYPHTLGCALLKALTQRSQELLRCLSHVENYSFRKPSCCVSAQKLSQLMPIGILSKYKQKLVQTHDF